jgi:hypothetical protein
MMTLLLCLLLQTPAGTAPSAAPAADALITGRVVEVATNDVATADAAKVVPVPAAIVSIASPGGARDATLRVLTDDEGRYFFDRLAPGKYTITVTKPGWIDGGFGKRRPEGTTTTVEIAEHERRASVDIQMWKHAVLSGTVVDEAGEPMVDIQVRAVRKVLVAGRRQMTFAGVTRTDDRGVYRLAKLVPGDYSVFVPATVTSGPLTFGTSAPPEWMKTMTGDGTAPMAFEFSTGVAASSGSAVVSTLTGASAAPAADAPWMAVPPTFAGTIDSAGAATFSLASGQERRGVDMQLRMVPTYAISGTLTAPDEPVANFALHLMSADLVDYPLFDVAVANADASGAFTFFGVPQGDYVIRVVRTPMATGQRFAITSDTNGPVGVRWISEGPNGPRPAVPTEPLLHVTEKVTVADAPVRGLQLALKRGARITGRAEFVGAAKRPAGNDWRQVRVSPERANGLVSPMPFGVFDDEGKFSTPGLLPGEYYLRATPPAGWTVKSVMWQGHDLSTTMFDLGGADVSDVVVTFIDQPSGLSGNVLRAEGDAPDATATVLVFPSNREDWVDYGVTAYRFAAARTNADGTFKTGTLPPGDYLMIAIPDDLATDWQDPARLAKLAVKAKPVLVREGEVSSENLRTDRSVIR